MKKVSRPGMAGWALVALTVLFAVAFSCQGFLTLGGDLMARIPSIPGSGWVASQLASLPHLKVLGFVALALAVLNLIKSRTVSPGVMLLSLAGFILVGGLGLISANAGAIFGFVLFLWFNVVQLSSAAGVLIGFSPKWAVDLRKYIVFAYIGEFAVNLVRFSPYDDGRFTTLLSDISTGTVDASLIRLEDIAMMFISVIAVEFTFVFFVKFLDAVNKAQGEKTRTRKTSTQQSRPGWGVR